MRHLISLVLGVILAPVIYVLAGIANSKVAEHFADGNAFLPLALGIVCILAAGGLYSVLVLTRLSPVGTVLAGVILAVPTVWALVATSSFASTMPDSFLGIRDVFGASVLFLLAAIPLLATVFSPRRWRSGAQPAANVYDAAPTYGTSSTTAAPVYQPAGSYTTPAYSPTTSTPPPYTPPSYSSPTYSPADTTITSPTYGSDGS